MQHGDKRGRITHSHKPSRAGPTTTTNTAMVRRGSQAGRQAGSHNMTRAARTGLTHAPLVSALMPVQANRRARPNYNQTKHKHRCLWQYRIPSRIAPRYSSTNVKGGMPPRRQHTIPRPLGWIRKYGYPTSHSRFSIPMVAVYDARSDNRAAARLRSFNARATSKPRAFCASTVGMNTVSIQRCAWSFSASE